MSSSNPFPYPAQREYLYGDPEKGPEDPMGRDKKLTCVDCGLQRHRTQHADMVPEGRFGEPWTWRCETCWRHKHPTGHIHPIAWLVSNEVMPLTLGEIEGLDRAGVQWLIRKKLAALGDRLMTHWDQMYSVNRLTGNLKEEWEK